MIILAFIVIALVAGFVANWLIGKSRNYETWELFVVGIVGSFVGGFLGYLLFGFDDDEGAIQPGGIIGSIVGAVIVLLIWRAYKRHPEGPAARPPTTA